MVKASKVLVVWHDAHAEPGTGWCELSEIDDEPCVVETVGWLLPDAKRDHLVVAQSVIVGDETLDGVLSIPVGMVKSVTVL